ncbi:hypothetical protein HDV00_011705, partial [Rhizophlyctis rosea]
EHLRHLVAMRIKNGQRYLFEKDQKPEDRGDGSWYGRAVTEMFKKVFDGITPAPWNTQHWRQIVSQHGKDKARGAKAAEAAHNKRMNHSQLADDQYYDHVSSSSAPPPPPETFLGAGGVNVLN